MTPSEKFALLVASVPALISLLGIYYNHKLSEKLKTTDEEEKEKRELRNKIQDRLAEFEEQFLPSLDYNPKLSQRLIYVARNVKIYDSTLSTMIRVFVQDWKKRMTFSDGKSVLKPEQSEINLFKSYADGIGDRADNLLTNLSITERARIWLSWVEFRINLIKRNWREGHKRSNS
jgi:hypothetical protein